MTHSGRKSQAQLCREHKLSPSLLASWRTTFLEPAQRLFETDTGKTQELARCTELEQLARRQAPEIALLK